MELRHLRYFVAVAEELNITRAAARLHVSQPPLSRQIRDLESELGVPLIERRPKSLRLTAAGRVLLEEARGLLARADLAIRAAREAAGADTPEIHVGYAPSPAGGILPEALRAFAAEAPGIRVVLHDLSSEEMLAGLREGRLDLALMPDATRRLTRGLRFEKLAEFRVGVIVWRGHPFAQRARVTLRDLATAPLVAYSRTGYAEYHEWFEALCAGLRPRPRIVAEADGAASLLAAVESGCGIALVADTYGHLAGDRVVFVPLAPAPPPMIAGCVRRRGADRPPVDDLVRLLQGAAAHSRAAS